MRSRSTDAVARLAWDGCRGYGAEKVPANIQAAIALSICVPIFCVGWCGGMVS